jgi:hypothetical protein
MLNKNKPNYIFEKAISMPIEYLADFLIFSDLNIYAMINSPLNTHTTDKYKKPL